MQINSVSSNDSFGKRLDPDAFAQEYANKNNVSLEEAKALLKSQFGDPSEGVNVPAPDSNSQSIFGSISNENDLVSFDIKDSQAPVYNMSLFSFDSNNQSSIPGMQLERVDNSQAQAPQRPNAQGNNVGPQQQPQRPNAQGNNVGPQQQPQRPNAQGNNVRPQQQPQRPDAQGNNVRPQQQPQRPNAQGNNVGPQQQPQRPNAQGNNVGPQQQPQRPNAQGNNVGPQQQPQGPNSQFGNNRIIGWQIRK